MHQIEWLEGGAGVQLGHHRAQQAAKAQYPVSEGDLIVPHPEMQRRRFVLVPLCELASYAIHPAFGVSVRGLMDRLVDQGRVELYHSTVAETEEEVGVSDRETNSFNEGNR